jgi:hypothetical protein
MKEKLKLTPIAKYLQQYGRNWQQHLIGVQRSILARRTLHYVTKGKQSRGRPLERWRKTVTDQ